MHFDWKFIVVLGESEGEDLSSGCLEQTYRARLLFAEDGGQSEVSQLKPPITSLLFESSADMLHGCTFRLY
jgi:hypothetical protein